MSKQNDVQTTKNDKQTTKPKKSSTVKLKKPSSEVVKKPYKNPTETWWGKLIVWIIIFGMVGLVILSFILALLQGTA
jgi:hypothetical protein